MIDVVGTYFLVLLLFQPIEECYNCNNPNTIEDRYHYICKWEKEDFFKYKGKIYLKRSSKNDNVFERYYRTKYWRKLGYYQKKRR